MNYKIRTGIMLAEICGDSFLTVAPGVKVNAKETQTFNETGVMYWHMLEKGMTTEEMAEQAAKEYEVAPEKVLPGLNNFLQKLCEMGFVEEID